MAAKLYEDETPIKKSEAKDVGLWHERVGIGKKEGEQWAQDSGAKRFVKEYKGDYGIVFHARNKKIPVPPINEVFAYVQADIASTYNRDPYIAVNAKAGTTKGAALWEATLNYWWRELKTKEEIELEFIDKDLVGFGWHKVGMAINSIGTGDKLKIDSEKLYSRMVSWKDVVWNVGSKRPPEDCQWMAQRIIRPLADIKKKYPAAKGLEGSPNPDVEEDTYKKATYKDDIKVGVMWEIWDATSKQVLLIAEGLKDRYLAPPKPWPDYLDEFPFLMYWDFAIPGSPRPMSAISPWEPQLLEEMILTASVVQQSKRDVRQIFVNNAVFDENALDKFERGDDGAVISVAGKVGADDLRLATFGNVSQDYYLAINLLQAIRRNVSGAPEFTRGGVTKTGTRTIGELQLMQQGAKGREERKQDRLETHLENVARHMMFHLKGNFDFENTVRITGEAPEAVIEALGQNYDPATGTVKFTPEEIEGEYDVDVKAGSTLPLDKQTRIAVMETILSTVATVTANGPMSPFLNALIQELLKDYDIKGLQEAYEQEVQMAQEAQAKAEQDKNVQDKKTEAEAGKREAQSEQIMVETAIQGQEADLGPAGRAMMEKLSKPDPKPAVTAK